MGEELVYIGCKVIKAVPMSENDFRQSTGKPTVSDDEDSNGYRVTYPDGYVSWSPKEAFENAYRVVTISEKELLA